jgi:superfamily II DNA or RNA helicase
MITITEPTIARFDDSYADKNIVDGANLDSRKLRLLKSQLKYIDKKIEYDIKRLKSSAHWYEGDKEKEAKYKIKLDSLKSEKQKSLLFEDEHGYYTYSGIAHSLASQFGDSVKVGYQLPSFGPLPYANKPKHEARPYQQIAHDKLLHSAHLGPRRVEIGTGLGKSTIIRMLIKTIGLKTVVMAPSANIADQLYKDFVYHFGKRYVGKFGDGKKQSDKLITVGIDDSLTLVEEGTEHWENLSKAQMFIADESHLVPSTTLAKVCLGLCKDASYRFFFSATQIRNDGLDLVLNGITGETVFSMTVREGIEQEYLSKPHFKMIHIKSDVESKTTDPGRLTRQHLYYNNKVIQTAASLANMYVKALKRPTVILVEELEQFTMLLPYLKYPARFAHGPLNDKRKKLIPKEYHDDDPTELVNLFNEGKIPILVGTSCIATGTDLQAVEALIYLQGKSSEIKTKQAVGRATRGGKKSFVFNPWTEKQKLDCIYIDFVINNVELVNRHSYIRKGYYNELYGPVIEVDM